MLGAVIISAAIGLVEPAAWRDARGDRPGRARDRRRHHGRRRRRRRARRRSSFAVGLSIIDVVRRSARPHDAVLGWVERLGRYADVSLHRSAQVTPGVVVYRLDDRLFFANASYVKGRVREAVRGAPTPPRWLVLDAEAVTARSTAAGLDALKTLVDELEKEGDLPCGRAPQVSDGRAP